MIVDLLRNDMGRVSVGGSVRVERLFEAERYPTLWQMTSTVVSESRAPLGELFAALFPSGSVTGAPKVRAMQIIRELESAPRGVYCGAVGRAGPGRRARFNVAIRTVTLDCRTGAATFRGQRRHLGLARGAEHAECLLKAELLPPRDALLSAGNVLWDGADFPAGGAPDRMALARRIRFP